MSPQLNYYYKNKHKLSYSVRIQRRLANIRQRVKGTDIPCTITVKDLVLNEVCPILGIPLMFNGPRNNIPSIDRINPNLGYVPGNVRIISFKANRWKNDMTLEDAKLLISKWNEISA